MASNIYSIFVVMELFMEYTVKIFKYLMLCHKRMLCADDCEVSSNSQALKAFFYWQIAPLKKAVVQFSSMHFDSS